MKQDIENPSNTGYHIHEGERAATDRLLTAQEVSELLKVPKSYVYWLTHKKAIPHLKIQGMLRFRESVLQRWLDQQEVRNVGS